MKKPRRGTVTDELNITSMMDMFTIILVFLLKSYSTEDISVAAAGGRLVVSDIDDSKGEETVRLITEA